MPANGFSRAVRRIEALAEDTLPAQALIESVADALQATMPIDALILAATDPDTLLGIGAGVVRNMPQSMCLPFWEYEFEVPDFNKFCDVARAQRPVADLHAATGGRPERSARWRHLRTFMDADAELRATFNAGGRGWGFLHVNRAGTSKGFAEDEIAFFEAIAPVLGRALRQALISYPARGTAVRGPGMAILDGDNRLVSATSEAVAWFDDLESIYRLPGQGLNGDLPSEVTVAAAEARARGGASRTRVRTSAGLWLLIHASCLQGAGAGEVGLVIEPAKASEVAPLIVDAYELTPREVDVTRALSRGLTTNEIAGELHLSRYTVQDHLKAVYEKTGVSSRGELVAKMFADHHYHPMHDAIHAAA